MPTVVTISERNEDLEFCSQMAARLGGETVRASSFTELRKIIKEVKDPVLFWDVDHKDSIQVGHPMAIGRISQVLEEFKNPRRVFVLTDQPLNKSPFLFNLNGYAHNVVRQYDDAAARAVAAAVEKRSGYGVGFGDFLNESQPGAAIVMKDQIILKSSERPKIVQDFKGFLDSIELNPQIASLAVQGADELLMNAIFDAPFRGGNYYRRMEPRNSDFDLLDQERVTVSFGANEDMACITVKDQFGSVKKTALMGSIKRDYEKLDYTPPEEDLGAGLGIYGILQSGLSLTFAGRANQSTEATLLVPRLKSLKAFRSAFRFFCFYC